MQKNYQQACLVSLCLTAVLSVWRIIITPMAEAATISYGVLAAVTVLAVPGLLVWCGLQTQPLHTPQGLPAVCLALATALTGALLAVSGIFTAYRWLLLGQMPFPQKMFLTATDSVFLYGLIFSAVIGGVCFLVLAAEWLQQRKAFRGVFPLAALLPVVWTWFRLLRFETSHVSTLGLFRNAMDLGMLAAEMLFFLSFARYVSGVEGKTPPRFFVGVALCTGMLCAVSVLTRFAMLLSQEAAAFAESALIASPDLGVVILAFSSAFAQAFAAPQETEDAAQKEQSAAEPTAPWETKAVFKEELFEDEEEQEPLRGPLRIEDVINDAIRNNRRKS